jgi:hypothetical protein
MTARARRGGATPVGSSAPCRRGRWPRYLLLADALSERVYKTGAPLSAFSAFRQRAPSTSWKRLVSEAEGLSRSAARLTAARWKRVLDSPSASEVLAAMRSTARWVGAMIVGGSAPCRRGRWPRYLLLADALSERVYKTGAPLSAFAAFRQRAPSTSWKRLVSEAEGLSRSESPPHGGALEARP